MPNGAVVQSSEGYNGANINVTWQNFCAGTTWSVVHIVGSTRPEGDWLDNGAAFGRGAYKALVGLGKGVLLCGSVIIILSSLPAAAVTIPLFLVTVALISGYSLGQIIYMAYTATSIDIYGRATGLTLTTEQRAEMWGEATVGVLALVLAAKQARSRCMSNCFTAETRGPGAR